MTLHVKQKLDLEGFPRACIYLKLKDLRLLKIKSKPIKQRVPKKNTHRKFSKTHAGSNYHF